MAAAASSRSSEALTLHLAIIDYPDADIAYDVASRNRTYEPECSFAFAWKLTPFPLQDNVRTPNPEAGRNGMSLEKLQTQTELM